MAHGVHLAVQGFKSESDDFAVWVRMFENSIKLAYKNEDEAALKELCIQWLPFKLDEEARVIHGSVTKVRWPDIKAELEALLIDPQEAYNWKARVTTIVWDGKENFHSLATRIKRAVDKFDPDCNKAKEYFFRFRLALPPDYIKAIDLGCVDEKETIEDAIKLAGRIRLANSGQVELAAAQGKAVAFTGASMSDDRLKSIEMGLQSMSVKVENIEGELTRNREKKDLPSSLDRQRERYPDRSQSRGRDGDRSRGRDEDRSRGRDGDRSRGRDGDRSRGRDSDRSRGREEDRSRGRDGDRSRGRDGYGRRDSGSRDGRRQDSRDRYRSYSNERGYQSRRDSYDGRGYERRDYRDDRRGGYDR